MSDSLVSLFKAACTRLNGSDAASVLSAVLEKPADDTTVKALTVLFYVARGAPNASPLELLDLAIAGAADIEQVTDDVEPEMQQLADYLAPILADVPLPIPRTLLHPLSVALVKKTDYPNRSAALTFLVSTYEFA